MSVPIKNVLLATEEARLAYRGADRPTTPWFRTAVDMIALAEAQGRDPWEAAREVLLNMHKTIARSIEREIQRRMREPSGPTWREVGPGGTEPRDG